MMQLFGGYEAYRAAPLRVVQEQVLVWLAKLRDEQERKQKEYDAASGGAH